MVVPNAEVWIIVVATCILLILIFAFVSSVVISNRRLTQERDFSTSIIDAAEVLIIVLHSGGRIIRINRAFEAALAVSTNELQGKYLGDLENEIGEVLPVSFAKLSLGAPHFEHDFTAPDGSLHTISWTAKYIKSRRGKGNVRWIIAAGIDTTPIKRAEEDRRRLETRLQQAEKLESLGVLAGGIAHDFNNLLVGIMGHASLALIELPPNSPARSSIKNIELAAQRAAELTNRMLAYSGKGKFVIQRINLSELAKETMQLLATAISRKIEVRYEFSDSLPQIEGDPSQLRQVVMNLITNASDAIGEHSGTIVIRTGEVYVDREYLATTYLDDDLIEGSYAFLEVSDTGSGMDPDIQAKIFDPFFTTKFTGRGLGLAAVLGIVRGHRGAIKVESIPGRGTTFRVLFPPEMTETFRAPMEQESQA